MRNSKLKARTFSICVILALLIAFGTAFDIATDTTEKTNISPLAEVLKIDSRKVNPGNKAGMVYSLDGQPIAVREKVTPGKDGGKEIKSESKQSLNAKDEYLSIIGRKGSGGLIYKCDDILFSNAQWINRKEREGDSIVTTLSDKAMKAAYEELKKYPASNNDPSANQASITVVLRDGSVICAAGNNVEDKKFVDYTAEASAKGSVWKVPTTRYLLLNNDRIKAKNEAYSLDEKYPADKDKFKDIPTYMIDGSTTIGNWDDESAGRYDHSYVFDLKEHKNVIYQKDKFNYEQDENGNPIIPYDPVDLKEALGNSSNTFILRHVELLGLPDGVDIPFFNHSSSSFVKPFEEMNNMFALDKKIATEINTLQAVPPKDDSGKPDISRYPYWFFGQDAVISSVQLCSTLNHVFTGEFYKPFYVAKVMHPDGEVTYTAEPKKDERFSFDVNLKKDPLKEALNYCFKGYVEDKRVPKEIQNELAPLVESGRILAKSGTAQVDVANKTYNNTLVLTVLDEKCENVIASACFALNNAGKVSNDKKIISLINVLKAAEIL